MLSTKTRVTGSLTAQWLLHAQIYPSIHGLRDYDDISINKLEALTQWGFRCWTVNSAHGTFHPILTLWLQSAALDLWNQARNKSPAVSVCAEVINSGLTFPAGQQRVGRRHFESLQGTGNFLKASWQAFEQPSSKTFHSTFSECHKHHLYIFHWMSFSQMF